MRDITMLEDFPHYGIDANGAIWSFKRKAPIKLKTCRVTYTVETVSLSNNGVYSTRSVLALKKKYLGKDKKI